MEKELKIVFSVFLVFFIYALTTFFNSGSFLAPFFFAKLTLVIVSLIFAFININTPKQFLLWFYVIATALFAITDENTIGFLNFFFNSTFFDDLSHSMLFLAISFIFYFCFHFTAIFLFYFSSKKKSVSFALVVLLATSLLMFFFTEFFLATISISIFFFLFFIVAQRDSELKNKTLRVISYQYLLLVLLGTFEYFI